MEKKKLLPNMKMTLKLAREFNRLTQKQAAQMIGVSEDTLSNYEKGKTYPDIPVLRKIEEVYGVPYSRLIFLPLDFDIDADDEDEGANE